MSCHFLTEVSTCPIFQVGRSVNQKTKTLGLSPNAVTESEKAGAQSEEGLAPVGKTSGCFQKDKRLNGRTCWAGRFCESAFSFRDLLGINLKTEGFCQAAEEKKFSQWNEAPSLWGCGLPFLSQA